MAGNFGLWRQQGAIYIVPMGSVHFLRFTEKEAIGTENLGSCSVVVIASTLGAILAHIPPQPEPTNNPHAGNANVQSIMGRIATLFQNNRQFFPSPDAVVVCAVYNGAVALPDHVDIMMGGLQRLGLVPRGISYPVPGNPMTVDKGTVMIMKKPAHPKPRIIVEGSWVNP